MDVMFNTLMNNLKYASCFDSNIIEKNFYCIFYAYLRLVRFESLKNI